MDMENKDKNTTEEETIKEGQTTENDTAFNLNQMLLEKFLRFEDLIHRYQSFHVRNYGPLGNPHRGQGRVLSLIAMKPEITQKELGYLLDMRNQSLGELLNKLEQKGFIVREPSNEDRRTMVIRLTEEGKEAARIAGMEDKDVLEGIFDIVDEEERNKLSQQLSALIEAMEKHLVKEGIDEHIFNQSYALRFLDAVKNKAMETIPGAERFCPGYEGSSKKRGPKGDGSTEGENGDSDENGGEDQAGREQDSKERKERDDRGAKVWWDWSGRDKESRDRDDRSRDSRDRDDRERYSRDRDDRDRYEHDRDDRERYGYEDRDGHARYGYEDRDGHGRYDNENRDGRGRYDHEDRDGRGRYDREDRDGRGRYEREDCDGRRRDDHEDRR